MQRLHIHIGGGFDATERRVLDVAARLDRGEAAEPEERLTFEAWEAFFRTGIAPVPILLAKSPGLLQ